ncbi:UDP-N-acetylmuramoylalanine--D-glutamate ligase [Synechococcus sp. BIOS-U3-1]|mgnify:FL=1|uniref:UDP-N-acetylmuramoyl-L-alanine--D-glutamate ligase n=1 Tax=Synechococcus sp. BIOS-U3-1 TaxID=1400865 RepID=UPI001645DF8A|nr:UDP-N-acetylmuramoyl-L-alanine--D-glutamate ligase [Synechococcus sp. BIOS-U3-1]QNI59648.1 UDP-N-acetylmuramoylalanine--D-glutamate ligase [Synechococcus sp. BIOS-U3-1]
MTLSVVVGLGRSGIGAARLLKALGSEVLILEKAENDACRQKAADLRQQGIDVQLGQPLEISSFEPWLNQINQVVISPGISWTHPTLEALRTHGVPVRGEMALAWESLRESPWIGITGTNGKTTVTHLLHHVLSHGGLKAPMAGNVGYSAAELALGCLEGSTPVPDWVVMEMSSYQIEAATKVAPRIGIWTTLTPDHLERHGSLDAYRAIKRGLLERSQLAILNRDDPEIRGTHSSWGQKRVSWVSTGREYSDTATARLRVSDDGWVYEGKQRLFCSDALAMPGAHNQQNMLLVTAAALEAGLRPETIESALRCFDGVPHRLESLGTIQGIAVFNDSKATNYDAAAVGLQSVPNPAVLLAGGQTKQGNAEVWLQLLKERSSAVVLFGAGADELRGLIEASAFPGAVVTHQGLDDAVPHALELARQQQAASLLLSPACASFDQYSDFEARGNHFRELIEASQST